MTELQEFKNLVEPLLAALSTELGVLSTALSAELSALTPNDCLQLAGVTIISIMGAKAMTAPPPCNHPRHERRGAPR